MFLQGILSHIHSLVPLRDAARAACVSRRFLRSWRCFPNLTFNLEALGLNKHQHTEYEERAKNVVDRVHHILQNHFGTGVKTLKLNLCACRNVITAYYVDSWLKRIVKPGIMELAVNLPSDLDYNFSCSLFSDEATSSLQSLFLLSCDFHPTSRTGCRGTVPRNSQGIGKGLNAESNNPQRATATVLVGFGEGLHCREETHGVTQVQGPLREVQPLQPACGVLHCLERFIVQGELVELGGGYNG